MERWSGRVAVVTGASAGIGAAVAKELVRRGMRVVAVARRADRLQELQKDLQSAPGKLYPMQCDVVDETQVLTTFDWITKNLGGVDVLINNAGIVRDAPLLTGPTDAWQDQLQLNIVALSVCTREAVKSMKARGVGGHIINIGSIAGHKVATFNGMAMYSASKHAVKVLTEGLRVELLGYRPHIKVSSISPGATKTEILSAAGIDTSNQEAFQLEHLLESQDISDAILYVLGAPPHVQIHELIIKPIGEVF